MNFPQFRTWCKYKYPILYRYLRSYGVCSLEMSQWVCGVPNYIVNRYLKDYREHLETLAK